MGFHVRCAYLNKIAQISFLIQARHFFLKNTGDVGDQVCAGLAGIDQYLSQIVKHHFYA